MNLKRTATWAVVVGVLAVWSYAAAVKTTGNRDVVTRPVERAPAIDARSEALDTEIARLHDRLHPSALPRQPGRNLFEFTAARPRQAPVAPAAPALTEAPLPAARPPAPFKLIGIAEDSGPEGPLRTAIVSAPGQLFLVKEGQNVTPRYRVAKISADVVELTDLEDGATLRLALK